MAITVTVLCIFMYSAVYVGGVYKSWQLSVLAFSFHLNLAILSSATLYTRISEGGQEHLILTSTSIAFVSFIFIVIYHLYVRVSTTRAFQFITLKLKSKSQRRRPDHNSECTELNSVTSIPTSFVVELHDPLIS